MAVQEQTPYIEYTANGTATSFALEFDCDNRDHLIVLVDNVEPVVGAWSLSNGAVVFNTAPENGKKITLQRNTPFSRTTDYQSYNNSFRPPAVNNDFDRVWYKIQELGVKDWLLDLKIQKFRDDVNLTALENTLEEARQIRDDTADSVVEVQSNVAQSQTLLGNTTAQANLAQGYANSANSANAAAQQAVIDVSTAEADVYSALSAQQIAVNNSLTAIAGGHKAYQTLAAAQAAQASLPANTVVEVTNDPTSSNNGTYQWDGTTLTKSAYDPLTQAKNYTDSSIDNVEADVAGKISTKPTNADLLQLKDVNGDDYLRIDNNGHIYLADRGWESLQTELQRLPEHSIKVEDLINIFDASGNLILRQDVDGYLYLPNMKDSVQVAITNRDQNADVFVNSDLVYERLHFTDALNPYLMKMVASTIYAPIPYGLLPSNYQIDDSIISGFTANVSSTHIPLTTVYRADDDVVHPYIIETIDGIRGYKYIMGITGYLNVREENPMIFGSNDLINFELLTGFVQPLGLPESTGYLSDIGFIYDPTTGDFICFWRCTVELSGGATESSLRYRRTKDLLSWDDEVQFFPFTNSATDNLISPAILFNPNDRYWYMWTVFGFSGEIRLRKARTLEGLATVPYTRILNTGAAMPWHIEVKWVGNKFVMILFNNTANNLFLGVSSDGESWVFNQTPLFTSNPLEFYKASFAASFDGNGDLYLDVLYNQGKKLYHSTTNSININGALV